jgi:RNA polymerase-associated protein
MPVDPVSRAQFRLALHRVERDWYGLAQRIEKEGDGREAPELRRNLRELVLQSADFFKVKPYFLSDEFSLVDATIAPILWRLPHWNVELPKDATALLKYAQRLFSRPGFRLSLSEAEREMRVG